METEHCKQGPEGAEADFRIYDSVADLPMGDVPAPLSEGIIGVCMGGKARFDMNARSCAMAAPQASDWRMSSFPALAWMTSRVSRSIRSE